MKWINKLVFSTLITLPSFAMADPWRIITQEDEMTGDKHLYAISSSVKPTRTLEPPYDGLESMAIVTCHNKRMSMFYQFTLAPNLPDSKTKDGYNLIDTRVRWDDDIKNISLEQSWGSKHLNHQGDSYGSVEMAKNSDELLLELNWYSLGNVYFRFDLEGSKEAISEVQTYCGYVPAFSPSTDTISVNQLLALTGFYSDSPNGPYKSYQVNLVSGLNAGWYVIVATKRPLKNAIAMSKVNEGRYGSAIILNIGGNDYTVVVGPYNSLNEVINLRQDLRTHYGNWLTDLDVLEVN